MALQLTVEYSVCRSQQVSLHIVLGIEMVKLPVGIYFFTWGAVFIANTIRIFEKAHANMTLGKMALTTRLFVGCVMVSINGRQKIGSVAKSIN